MSWQDELDEMLTKLNVHKEEAQPEQKEPFVFVFPSRMGAYCRLEVLDIAHLHIYIPTLLGCSGYSLRLTPFSFLAQIFDQFTMYQGGSQAFQDIEGGILFNLFVMMARAMEALFWQGDLEAGVFPPEIEVRRLF